MSVSQLVGITLSSSADLISSQLAVLVAGLPSKQSDSPVLQFYHGLGLGLYLASLLEENYMEIAGTLVRQTTLY